MTEPALFPEDENAKVIEKKVREEVEEIKGFYIHLGVYAIINLFLIVLNLITTPGYFWAIWPLLGWGVGVGAHAVATFGLFGIGSKDWEERKVRELMIQRQQGLNAEQVRALLHEELSTGTRPPTGSTDLERILRRLENLEAIVTSKDWDDMEPLPEPPPSLPEPRLDIPEESQDPAEDAAARLARRVR